MTTILVPLFIGVGFIYVGFMYREKVKKILANGEQAEAIIYDYDDSDTNYKSEVNTKKFKIRFVTKKQEWITKVPDVSYSSFFTKPGDKISVIYNPESPSEFIIDDFTKNMSPIFIAIGTISLLASIYFLIEYLEVF